MTITSFFSAFLCFLIQTAQIRYAAQCENFDINCTQKNEMTDEMILSHGNSNGDSILYAQGNSVISNNSTDYAFQPSLQSVPNRVFGTLRWTDNQEQTHPLVGAKLQITCGLSQIVVATSHTDENGNYSFECLGYDNDFWYAQPKLHLRLDTEYVNIASQSGTIYDEAIDIIKGNTNQFEYSDVFRPDNYFGKATHIFQAAFFYSTEAKKIDRSNSLTKCTFRYPYIDDNHPGISFYRNNNVYIDAYIDENTGPNTLKAYASWDVVGHEYGHHLQKCFGISDNPGGTHSPFTSDIDSQFNTLDDNYDRIYTIGEAKQRGIAMAWGEAWSTFWAEVAQTHFPDDIKNIETVSDSVYNSYNTNFWLNVIDYGYDYTYSHGEADEIAIIRILYKLWSQETDSYDKFCIPEETLFSIVIDNHIKTFHEFVNVLYDLGYDKYDLGKLFGRFRITTNFLYMRNAEYIDSLPTFVWTNDSGSFHLPYNEFDLLFFNSNMELVLRIECIHQTEYTLTNREWANIVKECGRHFYASVVSKETATGYQSGSYHSELFNFDIPYFYSSTAYIKPSDWGFEPQYFFTTNKWKQTSTPLTRGALTITHDRLRCGYIENSYIVLSPKRENAGLAYLTLNFDKPVYSYAFGVAVWSTLVSEGLSPSTCTAKIEALDANGVWREELDLLNDVTLSSRTQQIDKYCTFCSQGIYGLRFIVTAPAVGNNRGRICIDKILLNTNPDNPYFIDYLYC